MIDEQIRTSSFPLAIIADAPIELAVVGSEAALEPDSNRTYILEAVKSADLLQVNAVVRRSKRLTTIISYMSTGSARNPHTRGVKT